MSDKHFRGKERQTASATKLNSMFCDAFDGTCRPPRSGISNLEPANVNAGIDVLLAQAETLKRLRRDADLKRKLLWAMAIATDCFEAHPESALAILNAARAARSAGGFDLAARMLGEARKLTGSEATMHNIAYEENLLARERDVAGGSFVAMAQRLLVYACQRCGRLTEYISLPCSTCGWRPTTRLEMSHSGRLCTNYFSLWDLLGIGRGIDAGRPATDVVQNLAEVASEYMADPQSQYRREIEATFQIAQKKKFDDCFSYREVSTCRSCGTPVYRHDAKRCPKCDTPLRLPPPLRLLMCLTRLSIHFQHNFESPKSTEFELFIRYLVSLQSKLFRTQETPSERERAQVLDFMVKLVEFDVVNDLGKILMKDPQKITYEMGSGLSEEKSNLARTVLIDFRDALQFASNWMSRSKALS